MRLLLDAHFSARVLATALRADGHDVFAVDGHRAMVKTSDESLLALASTENRILVTCDVADFSRLTRRWAEGDRSHAGCIFIVGIDHGAFGLLLRVIRKALADRPEQDAWRDITHMASRSSVAD